MNFVQHLACCNKRCVPIDNAVLLKLTPEIDILSDAHLFHKGKFLEDDSNASLLAVPRSSKLQLRPIEHHRTSV